MQREYKEAYDPGSHYRVAGHPVPGSARRARAADAVAAHGRRRVRHDHLGRERREPDAHARRAPRARAGGARGARRRRRRGCAGCCWSRTSCSRSWAPRSACVIAVGGVRLLTSLAERYSPRANEIRLDGVVLGFTLALSVALALLLSFVASLPKEGTLRGVDRGGRAADERQPAEAAAAARARRRADRGVGGAARRRRAAHAHDAAARPRWTPASGPRKCSRWRCRCSTPTRAAEQSRRPTPTPRSATSGCGARSRRFPA